MLAAGLVFLATALLPLPSSGQAPSPVSADEDIVVEVVREGDTVSVAATILAPVDIEIAWQVLCDFDHLADFVPSIEHSKIISKPGEPLVIEQRGFARFGPFGVPFDTVRAVELVPPRIVRTRMLRGNMRELEATMELEAAEGGTQMTYHAKVEPDFWLPPLLGPAFIRHETRGQLGAMIKEMKRREARRPAQ